MTAAQQPTNHGLVIMVCGVRGQPRGQRCVRYAQCPDCLDMFEVDSKVPHQCSLPLGDIHG